MDENREKIKKIISVACASAGAAFALLCAALWGAVQIISLWNVIGSIEIVYITATILFGVGSAALAVVGALLGFKNKEYGAVFCVYSFALQLMQAVNSILVQGYSWDWRSPIMIAGNTAFIVSLLSLAVATVLAKKQRGIITALGGSVLSLVSGFLLSLLIAGEENYELFTAGFIIFGLGGAVILTVGGIASLKGKNSFGVIAVGLLCALMFYLIFCLSLNGIIYTLLGIGGSIWVLIGGVMVADSRENGFVVIAFGIIFLLVWLALMAFKNWLMAIAAVLICGAVVLTGAKALFMYREKNDNINIKSN